jgi:hypothetical protein
VALLDEPGLDRRLRFALTTAARIGIPNTAAKYLGTGTDPSIHDERMET